MSGLEVFGHAVLITALLALGIMILGRCSSESPRASVRKLTKLRRRGGDDEVARLKRGQSVVIRPTVLAGEYFGSKITRTGLDRLLSIVLNNRTNSGICTILLPEGTAIPGYSHPLPAGELHAGRHCLLISEEQLQLLP